MLEIQFTPQFQKDSKRLSKKHYNLDLLKEVIDLVAEDTDESRSI